ncbi:hypothetical protein ACE2AJ_04440 [Aquihabitans daechungensis]|uniref:hypothetical protein n=1 Tax=Aquihabitans daechungensis TaxID=1052257 RepID=UPI003BA001F2
MPDPETTAADAELIAVTERWFLDRGIPHFIEGSRAKDDVFTRALPILTLVFLVELLGAANLEWAWWVNLGALAAGIGVAVGLWAAVNALRGRRWSRLPDTIGPVELAAFVLIPAVLPLIGGQVVSAVVTAVVNLLILGIIYLVLSYGLVPMTRWAFVQTTKQLGAVAGLFGRALPLLLLFTVALFINTEVWQVAASLDGLLYWTTVFFFVLAGTLFLLLRLPGELAKLREQLTGEALIEACEGTPMEATAPELEYEAAVEPVPLGRRQQGNVLLVLFFSQAVQILLVSVAISAFFFVFGLFAIRPEVIGAWLGDIGTDTLATWTLFGREIQLTRALIHVAGFIGALSGFYFTVYVITDATYREEFFTEIIADVRQSLAVRNVYLALRRRARTVSAPT